MQKESTQSTANSGDVINDIMQSLNEIKLRSHKRFCECLGDTADRSKLSISELRTLIGESKKTKKADMEASDLNLLKDALWTCDIYLRESEAAEFYANFSVLVIYECDLSKIMGVTFGEIIWGLYRKSRAHGYKMKDRAALALLLLDNGVKLDELPRGDESEALKKIPSEDVVSFWNLFLAARKGEDWTNSNVENAVAKKLGKEPKEKASKPKKSFENTKEECISAEKILEQLRSILPADSVAQVMKDLMFFAIRESEPPQGHCPDFEVSDEELQSWLSSKPYRNALRMFISEKCGPVLPRFLKADSAASGDGKQSKNG